MQVYLIDINWLVVSLLKKKKYSKADLKFVYYKQHIYISQQN